MFFGSENGLVATPLAPSTKVIETGVYRGAHYYSHTPMIRIMLDLGPLEQLPTDRIPGFTEDLLAKLPGLEVHGCSYRASGGFVKRMRQGTWLGHVVEHVALELQTLCGCRTTRGKTRSVKGEPGVYNVMFAYDWETLGLAAGRAALEVVESLLPDGLRGFSGLDRVYTFSSPYELEDRLAELRRIARRCSFGPTTKAIVAEAVRRGIPTMRLDDKSLVQLGHGARQRRIRASITGQTSHVAVDAASNKEFTKRLLETGGIPVPRGVVVRTVEDAILWADRLGYPLVAKPLDGNHGRGVTTAIADESELRFAFGAARGEARGSGVILERFFPGRDHRILVIGGRVIAVAERVPAHIVGDGVRTVAELIAVANRDPRRGEGHERVMTRIQVDNHMSAHLARMGMTVASVPKRGQTVVLRATANLSTGGSAIDRTDEIHPDNAALARRAARIIGLDIAGIDFIAPDIARSVRHTGGGIIEVNAAPGFRMHLEPSQGVARNVAGPVLDMLFPAGKPSRIPIFAITGTNGKSTTARMLEHILRSAGYVVGLTSTSGVYIDGDLIVSGDATGPRSAKMVLRDPTVEAAVLETARGGLLREGLGFDRADVGAVLNISPDHLGLKGMQTVEDLADVKSLVVEVVHDKGTSVLNADDPLTRRIATRARGRIAWFSMHGGNEMAPWLREHIDSGGLAIVRERGSRGDQIVIHNQSECDAVIEANLIPATLNGLAEFNVANAMAAVAMAASHGVSVFAIRSALAAFQSSFDQNPGRLNVHDGHGFRVIVDYAHNVAGLQALGAVVKGLAQSWGRTIGCISIPGDRRDEDIVAMGHLAGQLFNILVFREDPATRGRPRGEVMKLMQEGALSAGAAPTDIHLISGETEAFAVALRHAREGDLVVLTPTSVEACWDQVCRFQPADPCQIISAPARLEIA